MYSTTAACANAKLGGVVGNDVVEELQRQCMRELMSLRDQLDESDKEKELLRHKIHVLTTHLTETTQELEHRTALYSDATERADRMERQIADAKKALLTREMRIHELTQQVKTQEMTLQKEEQAKSHWEREYVAAKDDVARVTRAQHQTKEKVDDKASETTAWKAKLQVAMQTIHELKDELDAKRTREAQLMDTLAAAKKELIGGERRWKSKVEKRDKAIIALERKVQTLQDAQQLMDERARELNEKEAQWQTSEATQQLEKRRQLLHLQDHLQHATTTLEKTKMNELLLQRELCRLREELLLSESQRKTEQRRHVQELKGKDKEMAFIWQKMEDLGFFNEREAECFEREDTLSQTDLEKLNVAEDMPEMERAEHLLKSGLDKQKISVLASLPKILASNNSKTNLSLVLDCMKNIWQKSETESASAAAVTSMLHLEIFRALSCLARATVDGKVLSCPTVSFHDDFVRQLDASEDEKKDAMFLITDEQVAKQLVPLLLDLVSETQHKDFAEAVSLAVIASLPRLAGAIKKTQIIRVAMEKGDVSQPPGSRLICCLLLGAVTAFGLLPSQDIEGLYFHKMMALCQDTDAEVRKCMCIQLDGLARAVGEEKACGELLPELLELLQDEEEQVKQAAFLALLSLLDYFPASERTKSVVPEFQNIAETLPDYLVASLSEQYGILVTKLAALNHLSSDVAPTLLQSYSRLCSHEEPHIRQFCAYNFPAIVKAFGTAFIAPLMDDLLVKLSTDSDEQVRLHITAGLHEVALMLGTQRALRYLKSVVLALLKDESAAVHGVILARMPSLMSSTFAITDNDEQKSAMVDATLKSIVQYHSILPPSRNRDQIAFVETLLQFPSWCSSDQMYEMVIPIVFDLVEDGARPVQLLAIQALVKCIRRNDNPSHRFSLLSKLRTEYGHSRSYWRRLLYLEACVCAVEINSRQYCRLNFLDIAMELLDDAVPNVRLKAAALVPQWKTVLTALSDDKMLDRIRQFLDECSVDNDRDVANSISDAKLTIEGNELAHPMQRRTQEEAEDKRRVAEEESLGLISDHEDSSADSKWSSMLEYTLVVGKDGQVVRRARVKSLDLATKLSGRPQGKDTSRGNGNGNGNGSNGLGSSSLGLGSIGGSMGSSSIGSMGGSAKGDANKTKLTPKTPSKPPSASTTTTLPNCGTTRPLPNMSAVAAAKMPPGIKVAGSTGKLNTSGAKSAIGSSRSTAALSKDAGVMTKIPIIRPSAPAKRESSPSTGTKPSSSSSSGSSSLSSSSSSLAFGNSSIGGTTASGGTAGPQGSALVAATMKNKLGSLDSSSVGTTGGGGGSVAVASRPKATAPSSASSKRS